MVAAYDQMKSRIQTPNFQLTIVKYSSAAIDSELVWELHLLSQILNETGWTAAILQAI